MPNLPKIAIITPIYNASKTLEACLESVIIQNYLNLEHVIVDGNSTDDSLKIIKKYAEKYSHIKYISEKDKGIFDAMNKGIDLATSDFLLFLGADDVLADNILNKITHEVDFDNFDLVYGKVKYPTRECGKEYKTENITDELLLNPFIHFFMHHQGTFIRKSLFDIFGKYDLHYPIGADVHFFIKTINHPKVRKQFINSVFSVVGDEGVSGQIEELKLRYEFPDLAEKHLQVIVPKKDYYRNFAKYYFEEIYQNNLYKGLSGILKLVINKGDIAYFLKNTLYWLRKRINTK